MQESVPLYDEVIKEIGTQTLARFGLNIFSLNTYSAYGASIKATNIVSDTFNRHQKNDKFYGQTFEDLDVGQKNISSEFFNKGEKSYTTDEIADMKKVSDILSSGKKFDNLNTKDQHKVAFILETYTEQEIKDISQNPNLNFTKNDDSTDVITLDKHGNVIKTSQHKVIKDTDGLLKDRYLENNDVLTVPFDDYKKHKENLEEMINDPATDPEKKEKAQKALHMLNKNNVTNRLMCENPKTTAMITQSLVASGHIAQAGLSDAIIVALSTLANGAIFEIKDAFSTNGSNIIIEERIKRLFKKVLEAFNEPFKRGATFGAIDVGVGLLSQIFSSISNKLKLLWKELRASLKSIFNAIWEFFSGKIKTYQELLSTIIKGLFSALLVVGTVTFEAKLEMFLAPLVSPTIASFLAPAFSIIVGSLALVLMTRSIDLALNTMFGVFAQRDIAKMKADEIAKLCEEFLPSLIEDRKELEELIKKTYQERKLTFETSFEEFKKGLSSNDIESLICGLNGINSLYGKKLEFATLKEFNTMMASDLPIKF